MVRHIVWVSAALALGVTSMTAAAQTNKQMHEQIFCNILGSYAAAGVADYYNHVSLDQALRRTDGYICTDDLDQVCKIKVSMIQDSIRHWYALAQQRGYETLQLDTFNTLADAIKVNATSACWQSAQEH